MKQNELRMAVHWRGSSEIKYLVMQDRKPVWFRTAARREQYSLRPRTHTGSQWEAIDQQGMRETQWDVQKNKGTENNRKLQQISADSIRKNRNGSSCGQWSVAVITGARMSNSGSIKSALILYNQTHGRGSTAQHSPQCCKEDKKIKYQYFREVLYCTVHNLFSYIFSIQSDFENNFRVAVSTPLFQLIISGQYKL